MTEGIDKLRLEKNLINAVKECPEIYAKTDKNYKNKLYDKMSWLGISEKLQISTISCCNMWYSMLQTFLYFAKLESKGISTPKALTWPHINAFKEMQPLLVPKYVDMLAIKSDGKSLSSIKPSLLDALLAEMQQNKNELMNPILSHFRRQNIWSNIANKLNSLSRSQPLPVFDWQKVWWDLKCRASLRKQLEMKGVHINNSGDSLSQDLRILQICGISPKEGNLERIKEQLQSCVEIDGDLDISTCEQCSSLATTDFACEKCSNTLDIYLCEICSMNRWSTCCNITNWSSVAKRMIPLSCQTKKQILICKACRIALNKKASLEWKVCRFCAQSSTTLENFSSNFYLPVMKIFHRATQIKFSLEDGLPSFICLTCKDQLLGFAKLFPNFVAAQTKLRDIHAQMFIGETVSRKRASTSKDLSALAGSNGVTASKQARPRSTASTTTLFASAMDNIAMSESPTPTNIGSITITKVPKAVAGVVGASLPNSASVDLTQDSVSAVQTNGSAIHMISNSKTSPLTGTAAKPNILSTTTVGQFVITEIGSSNDSVATGLEQNLNRPSTSNLQVTKVSTPSPQIAAPRSNEKNALTGQPRTYASALNCTQGASSTARPSRRIIPKPCTSAIDTRNAHNLQSVTLSALNYEQLNKATQQSSPVGRAAKKPPQRRMTIHMLSQPATSEISPRPLVPAPASKQPQVADGKSPAQWPLTVQKQHSRKQPQRRLTIHNMAVPSPKDSVVTNRSNTPQSEVHLRATASQSKIVQNETATRYYVPLKGGDSPASTKTPTPTTPRPKTPSLKTPRAKTPTPKTPRAKTPTPTTPRAKTPTPKTLTPKTLPPRRMTIHQLVDPNCTIHDTPQREMQISRRYSVAPMDNIDKITPAERPAPVRQRRPTDHYLLTEMSPQLQQPPTDKAPLSYLPSSVTKQTTQKQTPARRKTSASTSRPLQRTPSPEIIIIPDDSPPKKSNQRQSRNFLEFSREPRMFCPYQSEPPFKTELALHASLLIEDDDEPICITPQNEDGLIELMTPSALINYAIRKAYNINTTPPVPQSSKMGSSQQTPTSNQKEPSVNRRSLRSTSNKTPPKTSEETNLRNFRKAK